MSAFATFGQVLSLLPTIIQTIKAIEEAVPGQGKGEQKLAAVREILELVDANVKNIWPQVANVIGVLVKLFNTTGSFGKA